MSKNNKSISKDVVAIVISIISLIVSVTLGVFNILSFFSAEERRPLSYRIETNVVSVNKNNFDVEFEFVVSEGAIGDIRVIDYKGKDLTDTANYKGGTIKSSSSKKERTFSFKMEHHEKIDVFLATSYFLVHGKDGSKDLSVVLFNVNSSTNEIIASYYNSEDLIFAELDQDKKAYSEFLNNYRNLYELLKEKNEL